MKTFTQLLNESNGSFTYEPNELTEIKVDYVNSKIIVEYFRTKAQLTPEKKETFICLHGMFGNQSVEQKFNELLLNF